MGNLNPAHTTSTPCWPLVTGGRSGKHRMGRPSAAATTSSLLVSPPPVSQSYARQNSQTGQASTITLAVAAWRTAGLPDEGITRILNARRDSRLE